MNMLLDSVFKKLGAATAFSAVSMGGVQAAHAEFQNNFETLSRLDASEARSLGFFTPPDTLEEVAVMRGVPVLAVIHMPERLAAVQEAIEHLPAIFEAFPPRAIILSDSGLRLLPTPLATAQASGPYILLGDGFFSTKGMRGIPIAERPRILLHEWAHVLQFYYADTSRAGPFSLVTHSTLLDGWPEATGWEKVDDVWELPTSRQAETTAYGRTAPIEDQADALSFLLLGQLDRISVSRVEFLKDALDLSMNVLTEGVFARPPGFLPLRRASGRLGKMLDALVPDSPEAQLLVAEDLENPVELFNDYEAELERRGFEKMTGTMSPPDERGFQTYRAEWIFGGTTTLLGAVILPKAGKSIVVMRLLDDAG